MQAIAEREDAASWRIDRSAFAIPAHLVIRGRETLNTSRVGDDEWLMECCIARPVKLHERRISFTTVDDPNERELVREFLYLAMNHDHTDTARLRLGHVMPGSLSYQMKLLRRFMQDVRECGRTLNEIDQPWLDGWLAARRHLAPETLVHRILNIRRLALYSPWLSFRALEIQPWGNRSSTRIAGYRPGRENVTQRIPESISAPALRWAMFYVDYGIDDLIARHLASGPIDGPRKRNSPKVSDHRLQVYISRLKGSSSRVPVDPNGEPAWPEICRGSGLSMEVVMARRHYIEQAIGLLGRELPGASHSWKSLPPTTVAWREHLPGWATHWALIPALAACYLVVALLSGMRGEEAAALTRNCLRERRDANRRLIRYEVIGRIFKARKQINGVRHRWVVIEPVARAIGAALKIQDHLRALRDPNALASDDDLLFVPTHLRHKANRVLAGRQPTSYLNYFAAECQRLTDDVISRCSPVDAAKIEALYRIPNDDVGGRWRWQTRQLRRTLARYIASQPFGVVAGMIQYGHASTMMFEGYAGTSESGFRAEIEEENRLARLADAVEMYETWKKGAAPGGPMGSRLVAEFTDIRKELDDLPGAIVSEERRDRMLENTAVTLHPGFINDCFFYADHALCLKHGDKASGPVLNRCRPVKCPNSVVTKRHRPALRACLADAESMKTGKRLSPLQLHAIDAQIGSYRSLLSQVEQ